MNEEGKESGQAAGWVFKPGSAPTPVSPSPVAANEPIPLPTPSTSEVAWSASEYIAHPKNASWFTMLGIATLVIAVIIYLSVKDIVSVVAIIILAVTVGVFAARQPRELNYALDQSGVHVGPKFYSYSSFKSFSIVPEGAFNHIALMPLKRFMPPLAVHFAPDDEDKIIKTLGDYLPYEEHKNDIVENFSRRVRF